MRLRFLLTAVILVLAFSGASPVLLGANNSPPAEQLWRWPPAPEKPRIQHVKSVITPQDLNIKKGFFAKIWEFIAGKDTADRIIAPHGVVADGNGKVYVADWGGASIHYFDFEKKKYDTFNRTKEGRLSSPIGVALDDDGLLYVSDSMLRRVFVFKGKKNNLVIGDDSLLRPTGIAVNKKEKLLYVVDTASHRVVAFNLDGKKMFSFGEQGAKEGEFNYPTHVAVDASGHVYVMDSLNFRVQIFGPKGGFVAQFGSNGTGIHDFMKPKGIAVDSEGHIWVSDSLRNSIQVFDRWGTLLLIFGRNGTGPGQFNVPAGLFMDGQDRLLVADSYNYRVQIFQYLKAAD